MKRIYFAFYELSFYVMNGCCSCFLEDEGEWSSVVEQTQLLPAPQPALHVACPSSQTKPWPPFCFTGRKTPEKEHYLNVYFKRGGKQRWDSITDRWSKVFLKLFEWNISLHSTDWLLIEGALLLIGLTQISLTKSSFHARL
jgi:hypothetical protein